MKLTRRALTAILVAQLLCLSCGAGAIDATAAPGTPTTSGKALVFGQLAALNCLVRQSLFDQAMGSGGGTVTIRSEHGQLYRAIFDEEYFALSVPPGRYRVSSYTLEREAVGITLRDPWLFDARSNQAVYVGYVRHVCGEETAGASYVRIGITRGHGSALQAFSGLYPKGGELVDASIELTNNWLPQPLNADGTDIVYFPLQGPAASAK